MDATDPATDGLQEATVQDIHRAMRAGDLTAREVTRWHLDHIERFDEQLGAFVRSDSNAVERAAELDERFSADGFVGPLHGVPVVVKDNVDVAGLPTTAGSRALADAVPADDATIVQRLIEAGAVVLGKTNLDDFARDWHGQSSLGGQTRNPYAEERIPGGSSAGTAAAVAANLGTIGIGTDTGGSVRLPAAFTNLVGLRPTTGLVSRDGIVPISRTHDTAGPITRTVSDAAIVLDVVAGFDPADPATARGHDRTSADRGRPYTDHLLDEGLDGARIGLVEPLVGGADTDVTQVVDVAVEDLVKGGATVEAVPLPEVDLDGFWSESSVVDYEFKRDLNAYLAGLGDADAPASLASILESGEFRQDFESRFRACEAIDDDRLDETREYLGRLARLRTLRDRVLGAMAGADVDALVYPICSVSPVRIGERLLVGHLNTTLAAAAGLPAITVPAGFTQEDGLPVGIEILGPPYGEPRLFELAYAYEQRTGHRRRPDGFGTGDA